MHVEPGQVQALERLREAADEPEQVWSVPDGLEEAFRGCDHHAGFGAVPRRIADGDRQRAVVGEVEVVVVAAEFGGGFHKHSDGEVRVVGHRRPQHRKLDLAGQVEFF